MAVDVSLSVFPVSVSSSIWSTSILTICQGYSHVQALELALEKSQKHFSLACEQEQSRRLRTDLLCLQEENAELQSQLIEKEERVDALEEDYDEQTSVLERLNISMSNVQLQLQGRLKEVNKLKVSSLSFCEVETDRED